MLNNPIISNFPKDWDFLHENNNSSGPGIEGSGFISNDPNEDFDKSSLEPSNKINFMPLKIGMINSTWKSDSRYIQIFGNQVEIIKIVGRIVNVQWTDQNNQYLIEDDTGRIMCILVRADEFSEYRTKQLKDLENGHKLVKIYGGYNPINSTQYPVISIYSIKCIQNFNESLLHDLDVMHTILKKNSQRMKNEDNRSNYIGSLSSYIAKLLSDHVKSGKGRNGFNVSEITRQCQLCPEFQNVTENHVMTCLKELEQEARVYQTIDTQTFSSSEI
ncbi:conserved Plasmodium protein, unknown function [Babesia microti strain RI]|uniref:Uncharacterized protein n=1 Tax=Babesia microti (strain RI) TaxID=1133968 RepID=A0A1N6LXX7_BABMR|nr:conserved Plasmodium protein, unknown function [Babesia microti strain RI]SIO73722.1 conserved Plasmodium protein, unknown function [Babesia microti strain RI]|eukprot:XP_021337788.1 conserved Plasmodium protein, unknown function [Babesia microti strain RI]